MSFKTLIVGLGQIGMSYDLRLDPATHIYSHARAFSRHPDFELIGAVDPDSECCKVFTQTYGRPAFETVKEALHAHEVDVVVISVPSSLHGEVLRHVLEYSQPSAILCEKPLATDVAEAQTMLAACAARKVELYVNYIRRCEPGAIEVKRRLDAGEIATPLKGVVWYSKGLQHNGSHFLNLLEHWLGPVQTCDIVNRGRLWDGVDPEPDVRIAFKRGEIVFMAAWEERFSHYTVELVAPNGRLRYERGGRHIEWQGTAGDVQLRNYTALVLQPEVVSADMERYQWHVATQLAEALRGRPAHICSGNEALISLRNVARIIARSTTSA
jgi:predicted dehydrogenase